MKNYKFTPALGKMKKGTKLVMSIAGIGYIVFSFIFLQSGKYISSGLYFFSGIYFIVYALSSRRKEWFTSYLELTDNEMKFKLNGKFKERRIPLKNISELIIHPVSFTVKSIDGNYENIFLADFPYGNVIEIKNILEQIKKVIRFKTKKEVYGKISFKNYLGICS